MRFSKVTQYRPEQGAYRPYVREIVEVLTEYQTEFEKIKERIFNVEKGKSSKQDAVQTIRQMFGDGTVISYRSGNDGVYGWEDGRRKRGTRQTVVRNYLNKFYGRGNDSQINETKADLNGSAFSLPENNGILRVQTDYDKNYGKEWCGPGDYIESGNNYGDTTDFYIIGVIE